MASTRKIDPDGLANSFVAMGVVLYSVHRLGLHPHGTDLLLYAVMIGCGVLIHYAVLVMVSSLAFWTTGNQGLEGIYFTFFEFSRLPRQAFQGLANVLFVWLLPAVLVSNAPARTLLHGFHPATALWLLVVTLVWLMLAVTLFFRGLRRYASASS